MRALYYILLLTITISSCTNPMKLSLDGRYDEAIELAVNKVQKRKKKEKDVEALYRSYTLANRIDQDKIKSLQKGKDPKKWEHINATYQRIKTRQSHVRALPTLYIGSKQVNFPFINAIDKETETRKKAADYYYNQAEKDYQRATKTKDKKSARSAFVKYNDVNKFFVYYKDKQEHQDQSYFIGSTKVLFKLNNQSNKQLPSNFEYNVMRLPVSDLNTNWVVYTTEIPKGYKADYTVTTNIKGLNIGPNQELTRQFTEQKDIITGYKEGKDQNGNLIQIPITKNTSATVKEHVQYKEATINGEMIYTDKNNKVIHKEPIGFKAVYENSRAQFSGDDKALSQETIQKINNKQSGFPTNEQIINFSGLQLQSAIKQTLIKNKSFAQ